MERKMDPLREVSCCSHCYYDHFHILNMFQEHFASSFLLQILTAVLKETDKYMKTCVLSKYSLNYNDCIGKEHFLDAGLVCK